MARILGPKHHLCRKMGTKLCSYKKCPAQKRPYRPGQHGPLGTPRLTGYGQQLLEKQKAKWLYGMMEKQFRTYVERARKSKKETGMVLQKMLESRLDNVVFRLGYATSRAQARQWVNHGHFLINGKKVDIPSYQVCDGDRITLHPHVQKTALAQQIEAQSKDAHLPSWLTYDREKREAKVIGDPVVAEGEQVFNAQMIVEFYSR
ncbi:MAG: 30S ribosomal protein S4 [Parcubacteria group bacterium CG08_land_8_20_14_0_20_48_21]|nr:MAG: 30S ribosomal protein S4 [Parcubacteria group bacterium CG2_30_48_51]PIS32766.1 MAG: 30S ribosomal protein S4 [Parcubacteria group bacterium CG08_land_8_20_14_0_20_48_21]PIW79139.1 MAG: 30S ribosomal protein S4 [Parcubacteria group bacterium CG_4_8_14_3_um_filter_48_16]PIY77787.1 MAG: 30S ribosomal protein S4 [Parcubacteria group bacterium CG_4_10_14_0_8_um_filter_48_154]PIZ78000.1 MAG: 30S ribosomal protein S4 [bacterium CG_4_10_14_0_2_um_filter_48_144]PJC39814.1 MAG: 30S ribosomal pr